jgi:hypothetical protein
MSDLRGTGSWMPLAGEVTMRRSLTAWFRVSLTYRMVLATVSGAYPALVKSAITPRSSSVLSRLRGMSPMRGTARAWQAR